MLRAGQSASRTIVDVCERADDRGVGACNRYVDRACSGMISHPVLGVRSWIAVGCKLGRNGGYAVGRMCFHSTGGLRG
jgi:hypothetical protein